MSCSSSTHQQRKIPRDLILGRSFMESGSPIFKVVKSRRRKFSVTNCHERTGQDGDHGDRKKKHREMERQRRQEMASLCEVLRSELPLEFIKGKRSMSDHMSEAVNYIKHLQGKIRELSFKRDELKNIYSLASLDSPSSDSSWSTSFTVNSCCDSVEVVICRSIRDKHLLLSTVIELLLQQGLDVVSCFSSLAYDGIVHTIHCELAYGNGSFDLTRLKGELKELLNPLGNP
ncbi:transcription factor bHLH36-like [Rhodamnia argentea]|uniref:Transcription factor bHLH36-like n=1 Tax=Rhodamnia argentea TaxID=178133 RepID=A0A8B8PDR0_9MYRT|nr:transcription factor bHLH36-like [Rhodamnia argentea]